MTTEWWQTFFSGLAIEFWSQYTDPAMTAREADGIARLLELVPGSELLDVPCGNGRLALALAARGVRAHGIDIAPDNIAQARTAAGELGLDATFVQGDMRSLPWQARFDAAVCFGNSFGYFLDESDHARFLRSVAGALRPQGRFLLDAACAESVLPTFQPRIELHTGGIDFLSTRTYDALRGRIDTTYTFVRGDEREEKRASHRIFTCRELVALLQASGFHDVQPLSALDGTPFTLGARLCLLARA